MTLGASKRLASTLAISAAFLLVLGVGIAIGWLVLPQQHTTVSPRVETTTVEQEVAPTHNYDFRDGMQYGYTRLRSQTDVENGAAASQVVMLMYAGKKDGVYQLHTRQGSVLTAIECTHPCSVAKLLTVLDAPGLGPAQVNVQRMRMEPNAVATLAIADAASERLRVYGEERKGKKYRVWVDETFGVRREMVRDPK